MPVLTGTRRILQDGLSNVDIKLKLRQHCQQSQQRMSTNGSISASTSRRSHWSYQETLYLLTTLRDLRVGKILEGTRQKNAELFKEVEENMREAGFKKSWEQIRMRWKLLKSAYLKEKRYGKGVAAHNMVKYFEQVENVLAQKPSVDVAAIEPTGTFALLMPKLEKIDDDELQDEIAFAEDFDSTEILAEVPSDVPVLDESEIQNLDSVDLVQPERPPNLFPQLKNQSISNAIVPPAKKKFQKGLIAQLLDHQKLLHESNQKWMSKQLELQREWQQQCLRQQMSVVRSTVELVTNAFTSGMQQMLNTVLSATTSSTNNRMFYQQDKNNFPDDDSLSSNCFDTHT